MSVSGDHFDTAYPPDLRDREAMLLLRRRKSTEAGTSAAPPPPKWIGIALSGGGIRSATFSLGVFQALSRHGLLRKIDYLSTVSGGGYFGAFLGRLFRRTEVRSAEDVESILCGKTRPEILQQLRNNGRYLSPNGAGDLLLAGAVLLRNWVAIHVVLLTFVLLVLLFQRTVDLALHAAWPQAYARLAAALQGSSPGLLWWSPWLWLPAVLALTLVVPPGWAYWLVETRRRAWVLAGVFVALLLGSLPFLYSLLPLAFPSALGVPGPLAKIAGGAVLCSALLALGFRAAVLRRGGKQESGSQWDQGPRSRLSWLLKKGMVVTVAALAFAVADTLGQTIYLGLHSGHLFGGWTAWLGGISTGIAGAGVLGKRLALYLDALGDKRLKLPGSILAGTAAILIVTVVIVGVAVLAHGLSWGFMPPKGAPISRVAEGRSTVLMSDDGDPPCIVEMVLRRPAAEVDPAAPGAPVFEGTEWSASALWLLVALVFSVLFGGIWSFLNRSSHHALYGARLTRAYLGASNPDRWKQSTRLTDVVDGDDISLEDYWPAASNAPPGPAGPATSCAPVHLINTTINETVDGRSGIQQQDRKGTGMVLGPCGISVGIRHHAVFSWGGTNAEDVRIHPSAEKDAYRVFGEGFQDRPEALPLGSWVAISGAAFSTGVGARTSLGISLLCGLGNIRLGYWWEPRTRRVPTATSRGLAAGWVSSVFQVQTYLIHEFISRFPGTAWKRWYLTDGGHFENLGGYELIRRRVPFMMIVDAGADPECRLQDLANLVRKARVDFHAEIRFLSREELHAVLHPDFQDGVGTLDDLRPSRSGRQQGRSRACASLAKVFYEDGSVSWLLYVKATLTGRESVDVLQYHGAHPSFPHESTVDQFFDEEQWESYRKLGEHVGGMLFHAGAERKAGADPTAEGSPADRGPAGPRWRPADLLHGVAPVAAASHPSDREGRGAQ